MSYEVFLARLDHTRPSRDGNFLALVHSIASSCIPTDDDHWHIGSIENGEFEIEMPRGIGTVQHTHASFRLHGVDRDTASLIFKIANEASLDIVNEGGKPHLILTDPSRMKAVQNALPREMPVVCKSSEELLALLSTHFPESLDGGLRSIGRRNLLYSLWTRHHAARSIGSGDPQPNVPGLGTQPDSFPIYVEAKEGEGPLLMGRRFSRYLKARTRLGAPLPDGGGIGGSGWQIRLPDGAVFTCKMISGYHHSAARMDRVSQERRLELWKAIIANFAADTGRRTGAIDHQSFVVSDGSAIPMDMCESRRARDEDG